VARWEKRAKGAVASGRVFPYLAATTASLAILVGFIATLTDQETEQAREHEFRVANDNETRQLLMQLDSRLAAIEKALRAVPPD